MAEFKVGRRAKSDKERYYEMARDRYAPKPELKKSVLELRTIYKEMDLDKFATMYQSKYGLSRESVLKIIEAGEKVHV